MPAWNLNGTMANCEAVKTAAQDVYGASQSAFDGSA
jgi:hypothetical protein